MNRFVKRLAKRKYLLTHLKTTNGYDYFKYSDDKLVILFQIDKFGDNQPKLYLDESSYELTIYSKYKEFKYGSRFSEKSLKEFYRYRIAEYALYCKENKVLLDRKQKLNKLNKLNND